MALSDIRPDPVEVDVDVDRDTMSRNFTAAGVGGASEFIGAFNRGLGALSSVVASNPILAAAGLAIAAGIVATAAPAIGALLSGAIIAAGGLGFIGLGAFLLREEPALKAAGTTLMNTLKKTFTDAAQPLLEPLVAALGTLNDLVKTVGPPFREMFQSLADSGAIESLVTGLSGLVTAALPGLQALVTSAGPFLVELGKLLPILGVGLSQMFEAIAAGGPGAAIFFRDFFTFIASTLAALGQLLGWLASVYPAVRQFFVDASAWIQGAIAWVQQFAAAVALAFAPLIPIFTGVWQVITAIVGTAWKLIVNYVSTGIAVIRGIIAAVSAAIRGDWQGTWNALRSIVSAVTNYIRTAVSATMNGIRSVISGTASAIRGYWQVAWNAMSSIVSSGVARIKSIISGLRATILGAFAGAAGWLRSAGRAIIDGLISGIQAGFGRVQGLLSSLTSMLPDWKGPAEVDRKILEESGRMVMEGFSRGMRSGMSAIRDDLGGFTADLPTFTGGSARGGDGASLGNTVTLTIAPGAIVVQGSGREAGEEAAEAILERLGQATLVQ